MSQEQERLHCVAPEGERWPLTTWAICQGHLCIRCPRAMLAAHVSTSRGNRKNRKLPPKSPGWLVDNLGTNNTTATVYQGGPPAAVPFAESEGESHGGGGNANDQDPPQASLGTLRRWPAGLRRPDGVPGERRRPDPAQPVLHPRRRPVLPGGA